MKTAAIYVRVRGENAQQAIREQLDICNEYALRNGYRVVRIYTDVTKLEEKDERHGLQALLADSKGSHFDVVLIRSIDRLARNLTEFLEYYRALRAHGKDLVIASDSSLSGMCLCNLLLDICKESDAV